MELTHVTVSLSNLRTDSPAYENEFLVDTGAIVNTSFISTRFHLGQVYRS
jgi:hypothetical protein